MGKSNIVRVVYKYEMRRKKIINANIETGSYIIH